MAFSATAMAAYGLAISVASTAATYVGQQQQASAQGKANAAYAMSQSQALSANTEQMYAQGQRQISATDAQANQKTAAENMQQGADQAQAQTNASARGVTGNSVDAIQRDYANRADMYNSNVQFNRKASDAEIMAQMKGEQLQTEGQDNTLASNMRAPQGPSTLGLVGGLAADAGSAYSKYYDKLPPAPSPQTSSALSIPSAADYANMDMIEQGLE
jgi:hypothetical protein